MGKEAERGQGAIRRFEYEDVVNREGDLRKRAGVPIRNPFPLGFELSVATQ